MTKKPLLQNPIGTAISGIVLTLLSVGMTSNANATGAIMAAYHAPSCQTCHTQLAYSKSEGSAGLNKWLAAKAAARAAYLKAHRPTISPIRLEWDAEVDQAMDKIPLSVTDPDGNDFDIIGSFPAGYTLSNKYVDDHGLMTVDFNWTPNSLQVNKVYTLSFKAKDISTEHLTSLPVIAKIRVWPAGNRDQAYVKSMVVSTHKWAADKLTINGKVVLNPLMKAAEKTAFLSRTDLVVNISQGTDGKGVVISSQQPITINPKNGNWALVVDFPAPTPFPCSMTLEFEGKFAARKITGAPKTCVQ